MNRAFRRLPRGARRGALILLALIVLPAVASAGVLEDQLQVKRSQAQEAKGELGVIDHREQVLTRQVSSLNARLEQLERPLAELELNVEQLEYRIVQRERRVVELRRQREVQRLEIIRLSSELKAALNLLAQRVVAAYKAGDTGVVEQLAGAGDLRDLFRREEALAQVVGLDERVIGRIASAERGIRVKRARNVQLRLQMRKDIAGLERERAEVDARRAEAQRARDEVAAVRADRDESLAALNEREQAVVAKLDDLEEDAKVLQDVIKNGSTTYAGKIGGVSASGLAWPVNGPMISPFGQRWGRLHAGVDIAAGTGTPIAAAASGVVTYAGWMGGYGNLVIVQHAGGLSTAYAHQSQIASGVGQLVSQGQVIGYIGCTGHCFGPHVHFETRVDGSAVDPMQYL